MKYVMAIALAVMLVVGAYGQQCRILELADELGLTDTQRQQLRANVIAEQKELIQLKADLAKAKLELKEMMLAESIDKNAALKKQDQINAIRASIAKRKLSGRIDRLNMLTAEQRGKLGRLDRPWGKKPPLGGPGDGPGKQMRHHICPWGGPIPD